MKSAVPRFSDAGALWLTAFIIFLGGSYVVETQCREAIGQSAARSQALYERTVSNERTIAEAPSLRRLQATVEGDVRHLSRDVSLSITTAQLLAMLQSTASIHHVEVIAVEPEQSRLPAISPAPQTDETPWLEPEPVTVRVRGGFRDLLYFIEAISRQRTLLEIDDAQVQMDPAQSEAGSLDADVHTTLYRLTLPTEEEHRIETAR